MTTRYSPVDYQEPVWAIGGDFEQGFEVIPFEKGLSPYWTPFISMKEVEHLREYIIN